jgi:AraC-like DNA-binding protein
MLSHIIVLFTGLLGFVVLIITLSQYRTNKIFNIYFAIIVLLVSIRHTLIGVKNLTNDILITETYRKADILFIVTAPLVYLYFKNLVKSQRKFVRSDLLHFVLPILFILEVKCNLIENTIGIKRNFGILIFFIALIITYNLLTFLKLKNNIWNKKGSLEIMVNQNLLIKKWSIYVYICVNFMVLRLFFSLFIEYKSNSILSGQYVVWAGSLIWAIIFIKIITSRDILYGYTFLNNEKANSGNTIKISQWTSSKSPKITNIQDLQLNLKINAIVNQYIIDIDSTLEKNRYFRDPNFSFNDFALKLNIPKSHLSFIFKYHSKITFSDFKKISRINDALQLIELDYLKTNTFDSLSKTVGFSSYNPFFTSFKDVVGKAPQEYLDTLKKNNKT